MDVMKTYEDLELEIEIWEDRLETFEIQKKALQKISGMGGPREVTGIDYSKPRVQDGFNKLDYWEYLDQVRELENHIFLHKQTIENLNAKKLEMESKLKKLDGLDYKVVYLRDVKKMSLQRIADELGYSDSYISKISSKNKKK